jgi:hypothetical protein
MFFYRSSKFLIKDLQTQNEELLEENQKLQKDLLNFISLYNHYHQKFINQEHVYYPVPLDVDAYAAGHGKAMQCVCCKTTIGSKDNFCRNCGVKLKYV